jgi:hypothetical protein
MLDLLERLPLIGGIIEFVRDVVRSPCDPPKSSTGDYDQLHGHTGGFGSMFGR